MPRFLGLKSYLTTNRSSIAKHEARERRRSRLEKYQLVREDIAERFKCPLCFGLPCAVAALALLVLIAVYVTGPYTRGLTFKETKCTVERVEISKTGTCSWKTEKFSPCYKIFVKFNTTKKLEESVLMENEQTVTQCEKCSYTFGKGRLFNKNSCANPRSCLENYDKNHGRKNAVYSCFYDPANPRDVFKNHTISRAEAVYETLLPTLFILLYTVAFFFVQYDEFQRRKLSKEFKIQRHRNTIEDRRHKKQTPADSTDSGTSESPSSAGSTTVMYRVRKKKMPCTKVHVFSTRDEEDVILEEKPISPTRTRLSNTFMRVTADKQATHCACVHHSSLAKNFELARERERFRPVLWNQNYYHNQLQRSRRALRYLPESAV